MAKKKTTAKKSKPRASKASAGKPASASKPKKKTTSRKKTAAKKPTTAKKAAAKAAPAKKTTSRKKVAAKKPTTAKKAAAAKSAAKKPAASRPAKPSGKKTKAATAKAEKPESSGKKTFASSSTGSMADARKAALKLAAAAGLRPVESIAESDRTTADQSKRLTKSPLTRRELAKYRELLLLKRADIVGNVSSMESEALTGGGSGSLSHLPQHMADAGSDTYDQSLSLDIAASQRKLLQEIDDAIERIDNNTYGICQLLGIPIGKARLEAKPWAKYSIEAARRLELGRAVP